LAAAAAAGGDDVTDDQLRALPPPSVHIARDAFEQGKASAEKMEVDASSTTAKDAANDDNRGTNHRPKKKSGKKSLSPCGFCVNWQRTCGNDNTNKKREKSGGGNNSSDAQAIEMVIGAKGIKQGKKPKQPGDVLKVTSRLCRYELQMKSAVRCSHLAREYAGGDVLERCDKKVTYQEAKAKSICQDRARRKNLCIPDAWVCSSTSTDFVLSLSS